MNIRITTLVALLLSAPVAALAQNAPPPDTAGAPAAGAPHQHGAYMQALRSLNLSDGQRSQLQSIMSDFRAKNKGVTDPETRKANRQEMRQQILGMLTPAQKSQLMSTIRQMHADRTQGAPENGAPPQTP